VLAAYQRQYLETFVELQRPDDRRHLVGLGPGAERHHDTGLGSVVPRTAGAVAAAAVTHAGSSPRCTSANRASETAAMSTTVSTNVKSVSTGGVEESSMPTTPSSNVAVQSRMTVPRFDPERSRRMSWMWSLEASVGSAPRRMRRKVTWVMFTTGRANTSIGATTETAAVTFKAPSTLTAAST